MKMCWLLNEGEDGEPAVRMESWSLEGWKVRSPLMGGFEPSAKITTLEDVPRDLGVESGFGAVTTASVLGCAGLRRLRCFWWQSGKSAAKLCASWSRSRGE